MQTLNKRLIEVKEWKRKLKMIETAGKMESVSEKEGDKENEGERPRDRQKERERDN